MSASIYESRWAKVLSENHYSKKKILCCIQNNFIAYNIFYIECIAKMFHTVKLYKSLDSTCALCNVKL